MKTVRNLAILIAMMLIALPAGMAWGLGFHLGHHPPGFHHPHGPGFHPGHRHHHRPHYTWIRPYRECWEVRRYINRHGAEVIVRRCEDAFGNVITIRIVRE